ncbi:aminoacyl-tRNA hydrolase [Buchnera aphidicola]|uniref:aminoacyl-tRNA hydrolase n=1 Tax=Buchnera aphidicola TaxID=9 RepID=UPI0031B6F69A
MKDIKMIVGLGNPLKKFKNTRHNIGTFFIYYISKFYHVSLIFNKKFSGYTGTLILNNHKIHLFISDSFMNISGISVFLYANFYKILPEEILVIRDELDLKPGSLIVKYSQGHNGHNGMRNILQIFSKNHFFLQMHIGIGRPIFKSEICSYVLKYPTSLEIKKIDSVINKFLPYLSNLIFGKLLKTSKKFFLSI